jgi:hypothetical protein
MRVTTANDLALIREASVKVAKRSISNVTLSSITALR